MKKGILILATITIATLVGLTKINAEQIVVPVIPRASEYYFGIPNWSGGWSLDATQNFAKTSFWTHDYVQEQWLQFGSDSFTTDVDYLEFSFMASQPDTIANVDTSERRYCSKWELTTYTQEPTPSGEYVLAPNVFTCKQYSSYDGDTITDIYNSSITNMNLYVEIEYTNGNKPMCTITGTSIICPTNHLTPYKLHIYTYFDNTVNTSFDFEISRHVRGYYAQNQQDVINSINNQTQEIINQNATYTDEPKEETEGKNETADYEQKEQQLMGSLDFNMTAMDNISINPNASAFVWQIADRLRSINPAIVLLMTSILGMGLIKLILNR